MENLHFTGLRAAVRQSQKAICSHEPPCIRVHERPLVPVRTGHHRTAPATKKAGIAAGLVRRENRRTPLVSCNNRAATTEPVIDTQGEHIYVLTDTVVEERGNALIDSRERIISI